MGAVVDRLAIDRDDQLKPWVSPLTAADTVLDLLITAGKEAADAYLSNDFLDDDGVTELAIPEQVRFGVYEWIRLSLMKRTPGVKSEKAGDLAISYTDTKEITEQIIEMYWAPQKEYAI